MLGKYINISLPSARLSKQPPAVLKFLLRNDDNYLLSFLFVFLYFSFSFFGHSTNTLSDFQT